MARLSKEREAKLRSIVEEGAAWWGSTSHVVLELLAEIDALREELAEREPVAVPECVTRLRESVAAGRTGIYDWRELADTHPERALAEECLEWLATTPSPAVVVAEGGWEDENLSTNWHNFKRGPWRASMSRYHGGDKAHVSLWGGDGNLVAQDDVYHLATLPDAEQASGLLAWADAAIAKLSSHAVVVAESGDVAVLRAEQREYRKHWSPPCEPWQTYVDPNPGEGDHSNGELALARATILGRGELVAWLKHVVDLHNVGCGCIEHRGAHGWCPVGEQMPPEIRALLEG